MHNRLSIVLRGLINLVLAFLEIFLVLRFLLRLFAANPAAPFVRFIYDSSSSLLQPFRGAFPTEVTTSGYALEFSTLFAIIIYFLLAYLVEELIIWIESFTNRKPE